MEFDVLEGKVILERSLAERRKIRAIVPPYLTEEGIVLFDRREGDERRTPASPPAMEAPPRPTAPLDLVMERMRHLADLYGYVASRDAAENDLPKNSAASDWYGITRKSVDAA